jgi:outer membrane protein, heavy metal efflux system
MLHGQSYNGRIATTKDRMMKTIILFIALITLTGPASSGAGDFPDSPGLGDYLDFAQRNHPQLASVRAHSEALEYRVQAAGALPDLKLGWGEMLVPVETRVGPQQRVFSISQSIPWFGTLSRKGDAARAQADLVSWAMVQKQWEVFAAVKVAWVDVVAWHQEINVVKEHLVLATQQEATAEAHFSSGSGSFAHALRAQMALAKVEQRMAVLLKRDSVLAANLNSAAGLPIDRELPILQDDATMEVRSRNIDFRELSEQLVEHNPQLKALGARKTRYDHELALAGMAGKPNLTIGLDYIMTGQASMAGVDDSGKDPVIARLGVSLPLWSGRVDAIQSEQSMKVAEASHQISSLQLELERQLQSHIYSWEDARDILHLNQDELLPRAKAILEAENARYVSGRGDFAEIIAAREELLELELMVINNEAQWLKADIGLDLLLGAEGLPKRNETSNE